MTSRHDRRLRDLDSIRALRALLLNITKDPGAFGSDEVLKTMLRSQGAMAAYRSPDAGVVAMSLNHHKTMASAALGDYRILDDLRRRALGALELEKRRQTYKRKSSKKDVVAKNEELEEELVRLREDLVLLQQAYDLRCTQARTYAESAGGPTLALCNKEQREITASLSSFRSRRDQEGNVVPLRRPDA